MFPQSAVGDADCRAHLRKVKRRIGVLFHNTLKPPHYRDAMMAANPFRRRKIRTQACDNTPQQLLLDGFGSFWICKNLRNRIGNIGNRRGDAPDAS